MGNQPGSLKYLQKAALFMVSALIWKETSKSSNFQEMKEQNVLQPTCFKRGTGSHADSFHGKVNGRIQSCFTPFYEGYLDKMRLYFSFENSEGMVLKAMQWDADFEILLVLLSLIQAMSLKIFEVFYGNSCLTP